MKDLFDKLAAEMEAINSRAVESAALVQRLVKNELGLLRAVVEKQR